MMARVTPMRRPRRATILTTFCRRCSDWRSTRSPRSSTKGNVLNLTVQNYPSKLLHSLDTFKKKIVKNFIAYAPFTILTFYR